MLRITSVPSSQREKESTVLKIRPPYAPEFRRRMVGLVRAGSSADKLAWVFGLSAQTIRNWVIQADREDGRRSDGPTNVVKFPGPGNILSGGVANE